MESERTDRDCRVCGKPSTLVVDETTVLCDVCASSSRAGEGSRIRVIRIGVG
jgi:endogenous inhibitor of DNA gyrase (YacG/DUF329 family)